MRNMTVRTRLLALQTFDELRRKSVKSERRGYGKEGSFFRATTENYDLHFREMDDFSSSHIEVVTPEQRAARLKLWGNE